MAYKAPKVGATTHAVKVDLPITILEKIDEFGKERNIITRNKAIVEFLQFHLTECADCVQKR